MPSSNDLPAIPARPTASTIALETLQEARTAAAHALLEADEYEAEARRARHRATRLRKTYERLLLEYNGQQSLPGV